MGGGLQDEARNVQREALRLQNAIYLALLDLGEGRLRLLLGLNRPAPPGTIPRRRAASRYPLAAARAEVSVAS